MTGALSSRYPATHPGASSARIEQYKTGSTGPFTLSAKYGKAGEYGSPSVIGSRSEQQV